MSTLQELQTWYSALSARTRPIKLALIIAAIVLGVTFVPLAGNMGTAHAATITCPATIQEGSTGSLVKELQTNLDWDELPSDPGIDVDGDFGPLTKAGVIRFQKYAFPNGPSSTEWNGQVGPHTWGAMGMCHSSGGITGGGCTAGALFSACISVGSGEVIPDTYTSTGFTIVYIYLIEDGNTSQAHVEALQNNPYVGVPGHFTGYTPSVTSGHSWVTMVEALKGSTWYEVVSPPQYT